MYCGCAICGPYAGVVRAGKIRRQLSDQAAHGLTLRLCERARNYVKRPCRQMRQGSLSGILDQGYIFHAEHKMQNMRNQECRPECSREDDAQHRKQTPSGVTVPMIFSLHAASYPALVQRFKLSL